jgi:hypothetical protein
VEGGLQALKQAGLAVPEDRRQPLELMRQVQMTASSMVLLGVVPGALVSPWPYALSGFAGAGLVFAGIRGTCGLATLLPLRPDPAGVPAVSALTASRMRCSAAPLAPWPEFAGVGRRWRIHPDRARPDRPRPLRRALTCRHRSAL